MVRSENRNSPCIGSDLLLKDHLPFQMPVCAGIEFMRTHICTQAESRRPNDVGVQSCLDMSRSIATGPKVRPIGIFLRGRSGPVRSIPRVRLLGFRELIPRSEPGAKALEKGCRDTQEWASG